MQLLARDTEDFERIREEINILQRRRDAPIVLLANPAGGDEAVLANENIEPVKYLEFIFPDVFANWADHDIEGSFLNYFFLCIEVVSYRL